MQPIGKPSVISGTSSNQAGTTPKLFPVVDALGVQTYAREITIRNLSGSVILQVSFDGTTYLSIPISSAQTFSAIIHKFYVKAASSIDWEAFMVVA